MTRKKTFVFVVFDESQIYGVFTNEDAADSCSLDNPGTTVSRQVLESQFTLREVDSHNPDEIVSDDFDSSLIDDSEDDSDDEDEEESETEELDFGGDSSSDDDDPYGD